MSLRRSLAWSYASQAVTFMANFATSIIIARLLSPHEMGTFGVAMATLAILGILTSFNLQAYVIREAEPSQSFLRTVFTLNAMMTLALSGALAAVGLVLVHVFGQRETGIVLLIAAVAPLIGIFEFIPATLIQRAMNYGLLSRLAIFRTVINNVVAVACAYQGFGAKSLAIGPIVAGLACLPFYLLTRRKQMALVPSFEGLRPALIFGSQMMSISGLAQLAQRFSELLLGQMLGLAALGLYGRASNLSGQVFSNVYGIATGVIFSKMSRDLREIGSLHRTFIRGISIITAIMWPLVMGIAVLAGPAIHMLYGDQWLMAALPLSILMTAQFVAIGFGMNWELFVLRGETARQTRFEIIRAIVGLALFALGATYSIAAAALGRLVEAIVGYFLYRPHIDRLAGTAPGEMDRIYRESLALTLSAVIPSLAVMLWHRWSVTTPVGMIAVAVIIGMVAWISLLAHLRHPLFEEVSMLAAKTAGRPLRAIGRLIGFPTGG